jgi:hypothetical protein
VAAAAKAASQAPFLLAFGQQIPRGYGAVLVATIGAISFGLVSGATLVVGWRVRVAGATSFTLLLVCTCFLLTLPESLDCRCLGKSYGVMRLLRHGAGAIARSLLRLLVTGRLPFGGCKADRWSLEARLGLSLRAPLQERRDV